MMLSLTSYVPLFCSSLTFSFLFRLQYVGIAFLILLVLLCCRCFQRCYCRKSGKIEKEKDKKQKKKEKKEPIDENEKEGEEKKEVDLEKGYGGSQSHPQHSQPIIVNITYASPPRSLSKKENNPLALIRNGLPPMSPSHQLLLEREGYRSAPLYSLERGDDKTEERREKKQQNHERNQESKVDEKRKSKTENSYNSRSNQIQKKIKGPIKQKKEMIEVEIDNKEDHHRFPVLSSKVIDRYIADGRILGHDITRADDAATVEDNYETHYHNKRHTSYRYRDTGIRRLPSSASPPVTKGKGSSSSVAVKKKEKRRPPREEEGVSLTSSKNTSKLSSSSPEKKTPAAASVASKEKRRKINISIKRLPSFASI
jgi:Na+-transporting methylmalonyl-CoA/oxaloacetate decarboxylase gamma subunit